MINIASEFFNVMEHGYIVGDELDVVALVREEIDMGSASYSHTYLCDQDYLVETNDCITFGGEFIKNE